MKYRKRPIEVEAMQYTVENCHALHEWMGLKHYEGGNCSDGITVQTLEGEMLARVGDWIIRGVKGEFYLCKPDIFDATYEEVQPS